MSYIDKSKNIIIEANEIELGENLILGKDIRIKVRGKFKLGSHSKLGDRFTATGENIEIGEYFYNNPTDNRSMRIGGGSSHLPFANLKIGSGVTCHTGHINLARPVNIGDNVGLSHDVDLITHGFWASVLKGYPRAIKGINIGNNVIVGWKTLIMSGVNICDDVVIGSHATVVKDIIESGIYVGSPVKKIKEIIEPNYTEKVLMLEAIIQEFNELMEYYDVPKFEEIVYTYPMIYINGLELNVDEETCLGEHDEITDAFRDHLRRYGIRIFNPRGFKFALKRI